MVFPRSGPHGTSRKHCSNFSVLGKPPRSASVGKLSHLSWAHTSNWRDNPLKKHNAAYVEAWMRALERREPRSAAGKRPATSDLLMMMWRCLVVDHTPCDGSKSCSMTEERTGAHSREQALPTRSGSHSEFRRVGVDQKWDAGSDTIYPKDGARAVLRVRPTIPTRRALRSSRQRTYTRSRLDPRGARVHHGS